MTESVSRTSSLHTKELIRAEWKLDSHGKEDVTFAAVHPWPRLEVSHLEADKIIMIGRPTVLWSLVSSSIYLFIYSNTEDLLKHQY